MISLKMGLIVATAFIAGAFVASPELRAYASTVANDVVCTGCVGTSDLAGSAVTAAKIKDSEVKAAEIATDAVGAAELQGVTKLLFGQCAADSAEGTNSISPGVFTTVECAISGVDADDSALAERNSGPICFDVVGADTMTGKVVVQLLNECSTSQQLGTGAEFSVMVYDK